jgi:hypothetical protein
MNIQPPLRYFSKDPETTSNMNKGTIIKLVATAIVILLTVPAGNLNAIPAFARKYQISCQVCHTPAMPRLKAFGAEFANNGFRMTEFEAPRYYVETGDEKLSLFREVPLAIRLEGYATLNFDNEGTVDFAAPFVAKILSGGELSEKLSYYFYFLMNETGTVVGLEDAFFMYHDFLNAGINLYVGQFQVSDPLFKGELRLTLEPYQIYAFKPEGSSIDLKYDRGIIVDKTFKTGTQVVGEIVNGSGLDPAWGEFLFDKDKYKNFMLRITQPIGKNISIGFFGYTGKEVISNSATPYTNEIKMYGPDIAIDINQKLMLNLQYVWRTDSELYNSTDEVTLTDIATHGGFAEIIYSPKGDNSKFYMAGLVNLVNSQIDDLDYQSATIHFGYLLRRNVRLVTEGSYIFSGINPYAKASAGVISAF